MPGENRFLIIGIDEYPNTRYKKISNAKVDGNRLTKVLQERYGFVQVREPIYDIEATHDNVVDAILDLAQTSFKEDNLIIYYAGHGDQNTQSKKGYWIPVDGENDQKKYIKNSTVLDDLEAVQAKHILLISDSCYSGTFISPTRSGGKIFTHNELDAKNSRWIFVSGGETKVDDGKPGEGSPFSIALCNFLENNEAATVSAGEIFDEVIRVVENKGGQRPRADEIRSEAHDGGQMIFHLRVEKGGEEERRPIESIKFPLPEAKVEYYIPRLLTYYDYQESKEFKFYQPEVGKIYLNSLIKSHKRIVVLGGAGSGKSVELLSQAYELQNNSDGLNPIYKRFNTYTEENLADYLPETWDKTDPANLVLFLDGLDEIQPKYFQTAIRKITGFSQQYPLVRIVISCRNNFYELPYQNFSGTLDGFSVYTLNDVSVPEIKNYVTDKFDMDGQDLIEKVYHNAFLDLVQKPFFLNILVKYYKEYNDFDTGRAAIMEEALLKYYVNDKQHFLATVNPLTKTQIFGYLEKIAFVMEIMGKNFLTEAELLRVFRTTEEIDRCNYLPAFKKQGDEDKWMFEHNNLQEYIASRVLNRKNSQEIIKIIAVTTAGEERVKPSWVNTLSFFISIGSNEVVNGILEWIIKNDREVIIKFESERLSEGQRITLFKDIFNFYTDKQIWLRSNNFSDKDLARFAESKEILEFLLTFIEGQSDGRIAKLNALHVLSNYQIGRFAEYLDRIKRALSRLLENPSLLSNDIYTVLGTIAELKISDPALIAAIIEKYRERHNQYIRAGMYKLLIHTKTVDQYVDIFLEGIDRVELNSSTNDRESVNLFDESLYLKIALESIVSVEAVGKVISKLISSENKRELLMSEYQEIIASLMKTSTSEYSQNHFLFNLILELYLVEASDHGTNIISPIISFFEDTGNRWNAFISIWQNSKLQGYEKGMAINHLMNTSIIDEFIKHQQNSQNADEQIKEFYNFLLWHKRSDDNGLAMVDRFEKAAFTSLGIVLVRPPLKDWRLIHQERDQQSFDLWFDDVKMLADIKQVFTDIGNKDFTREDLFNYNYSNGADIEGRMAISVNLIFNHLTMRGRIVDEEEIVNYVLFNEDYQYFRIGHIHADVFNKKQLIINADQEQFIKNWAITIGNNRKFLWDFINRFDIQLPDEKVLDLTNYTHFNYDVKLIEPGSIEQLEKFISKSKLKYKVLENLKNPELNMLAWTSNAGYALRHNFSSAYVDILRKLEVEFDYEYKFREILKIWFDKTQNIATLKQIIVNVRSTYLRWEAIKILDDTEKEPIYLNELFHQIVDDEGESVGDKIYAANHLMRQNDLCGFYYLSNMILSEPDPRFDYRRNLGSVSMLKDTEAIPTLIKLLEIAKKPDFKLDVFNDMEERVLSAFHNIGIQSSENYIAVKTSLEKFIIGNADKLPNVNFLYFTIVRIEEQLKMKYMAAYTIDDALLEYNSLFNN
jgi:hypothetical protein